MQKVVIFGFNEFAKEVARHLPPYQMIVAVFDKEERKRAELEFFQVIEILGFNEKEFSFLKGDEIVVCSLKQDEKNLFLALTLRTLYPTLKIVARVNEKSNEGKYRLVGVNKIINPYEITTNLILTILQKPVILNVLERIVFNRTKEHWQIREITLSNSSPLTRRPLKQFMKLLTIRYNLVPVAVALKGKGGRDKVLFISSRLNHPLRPNDGLIVIGEPTGLENFEKEMNG
ncbi:MAG: TrkA family potassium uptake protein [Epsilonproteobacteria bacterium]|nr:TrkA family potassium uptake protein [Campylobacterota bacterium]